MSRFNYRAAAIQGVQLFHGQDVSEPSPEQFHAELELGWVQRGRVRLGQPGAERPGPTASAGEAVLVAPGVTHSVEVLEPCTFLVAYVARDLVQQLLESRPLPRVAVFPAAAKLQAALRSLAEAADADAATAALRAAAALVPRGDDVDEGRPTPQALEAARTHITRNLTRPFDLSELADVAGWSRWHLSRTFTAYYGLSPRAYHRHLRLEAARAGLLAGASVGEVADELGFADRPHLSRAFRTTFKVNPSQYRADLGRGP